jgi:TM2 domain-containing membrane protein YozV
VNTPSVQPFAPTKSTGVAYVLWFFFGGIGAHKFYLGRPGIGILYIGMFVLFWAGMFSLLSLAIETRDAIAFATQHGHYSAPRDGSWGMSYGVGAPAMVMPLSIAVIYDLVTMPSQVHAANARLDSGSQQTSGAPSARSAFGSEDREAELSAKKADELVARYIARQAQATSTAPARAAQAAPAGAPTFGRRGR